MKLFIDSANIEEIVQANSFGFLTGVTTNPSLVAREAKEFHFLIREIASIVRGPINAEVLANDSEAMVKEAAVLSELASNIVVKIPMTSEGLKAVNALSTRGIQTNVTLVFSPAQALLASHAGANFVSVFLGRADDVCMDSLAIVERTADIFHRQGVTTKIIAASIRSPKQVVDAGIAGAHIATVPLKVLNQMMMHPLTDAGLDKFAKDWKQRACQ